MQRLLLSSNDCRKISGKSIHIIIIHNHFFKIVFDSSVLCMSVCLCVLVCLFMCLVVSVCLSICASLCMFVRTCMSVLSVCSTVHMQRLWLLKLWFLCDLSVAPLFPSSRLLLGLMNCLALLFLYLLRINLSISMVCMVRKPVLPMVSNVSSSDLSLNESSFLDLHSETTNFRFDPSLHMSVIPTSTPASVQSSAILSHIIGTIVPPSAARDAADLVPVSVSNASRFIRAAANSLMSSSSADIVGQSVTHVMAENMEDDYNATNDKATVSQTRFF